MLCKNPEKQLEGLHKGVEAQVGRLPVRACGVRGRLSVAFITQVEICRLMGALAAEDEVAGTIASCRWR